MPTQAEMEQFEKWFEEETQQLLEEATKDGWYVSKKTDTRSHSRSQKKDDCKGAYLRNGIWVLGTCDNTDECKYCKLLRYK